jgi:arylsulfatase A-like enzyme
MSDAYHVYASQRGLGDARAHIEFNLNHPEWEGETLTLHDPSPWHFMNGSGVLEGPPEGHEEQFVARLAIDRLRELSRSSQPWSLVTSFWGPHHPYFPTEPYASMIDPETIPEYPSFDDDLRGRPLRHHLYRGFRHTGSRRWRDWAVWQRILARCYGQALQLDAAVGEVLDSLETLGVADDTLVIWCADHGDTVASHGGLWDKGSIFSEEVARVPMAIRWPERLTTSKTIDQLVSNMDVTATMLAAAGIAPPAEMDSRSLLPLAQGSGAEWPETIVCEHNGHGQSIVQRIIYRGRFKYVAALYDGDELYDLVEDPYELSNLVDSSAHADVADELRVATIDHIERNEDRVAERLAYALRQGF